MGFLTSIRASQQQVQASSWQEDQHQMSPPPPILNTPLFCTTKPSVPPTCCCCCCNCSVGISSISSHSCEGFLKLSSSDHLIQFNNLMTVLNKVKRYTQTHTHTHQERRCLLLLPSPFSAGVCHTGIQGGITRELNHRLHFSINICSGFTKTPLSSSLASIYESRQ